MCIQTVAIGGRMIIETLNPLNANRLRNRTVIRTQNRTRVDVLLDTSEWDCSLWYSGAQPQAKNKMLIAQCYRIRVPLVSSSQISH
jgi:hypothetical protein